MTQQNTLIVKSRSNGLRLDQFVMKSTHPVAELPRKEVQTLILGGKIQLNGKSVRPSHLVQPGDLITVLQAKTKIGSSGVPIPHVPVVFENEHFLVLNKPAGLTMHPARVGQKGTLVDWILKKYPAMHQVGDDPLRPGIVHRLDKETSGLVLLAKTQKAYGALKELFGARQVEKSYMALVYGKPVPKSGTITLSLGRVAGSTRRGTPMKKRAFAGKLREAITEYTLVTAYPQYSLLLIKPKTGRTHQIRVHLASIGHPVVGDQLYSFKKHKKGLFPVHQLLHAQRLTFSLFGENFDFECSPPTLFDSFLKSEATLHV